MAWQIILFLLPIISVHCLPVGNRNERSANDPSSVVTMSESIWHTLVDNEETGKGVYAVFDKTQYFVNNDDFFKPEVYS